MNYLLEIEQKLIEFSEFSEHKVWIKEDVFTNYYQSIKDFISETKQSLYIVKELQDSSDNELIEIYTKKLSLQIILIAKEVQKLKRNQKPKNFVGIKKFTKKFNIPKDIHTFSPKEKLKYYYQSLRGLDEIIAFYEKQLLEQEDFNIKNQLLNMIEKTEQRKKRCFEQIEILEANFFEDF